MSIETLNPDSKAVVISSNPKSGSGNRQSLVDRTAELLRDKGFEVHSFTDIERVVETAGTLFAQGRLRTVLGAGGDGTAALLANSLDAEIPISILPLGTENLLAKYFGLTASPEQISELIAVGKSVRLDAGTANGKLFLIMVGCGFDAEVVQRLHSKRTGHIRHWSYARPILSAIRRYRFPNLKVEIDGEIVDRKNSWVFVFNVPRYAMNLRFVDDADCLDGRLDLITFRKPNLLNGLFYLLTILFRNHRGRRDVFEKRFETLRISSEKPVQFQMDGDPGGELPVEIKVVPKRVRVLVSEAWIAENLPPSTS